MASKKTHGWAVLKPGDVVDLVAPGFRPTEEDFTGALVFLANWGLEARYPAGLFGRDVLCSNDDRTRFEFLKDALHARDSKAIWCVRGGYGSIRLVPELMKLKRPKGPPKLFVGLSDITTLHLFLKQEWGWPTVHGPLLDRLGKGAARPRYVTELKKYVFGDMNEIEFKGLKALNSSATKRKVLRGSVSGGNLITLQSSLGTPVSWRTKGEILFFEDIGERGYRVDRVLEHFDQVGVFKKAKAVVFGQFTGGAEADGKSLTPAVIKRFAHEMDKRYGLPVFSGLDSGHGVVQRPLPFGTESVLHLGERGRLICATGKKA